MHILGYSNPTFRNFSGELGGSILGGTNGLEYFVPPPPPLRTGTGIGGGFVNYKSPNYSPTPTFAPQKVGTSLKLNEIFQGGLGVFSQWIAGNSRNPTAQILTGGGAFRPIEQNTTSNPTYGTGGMPPEQQAAARLEADRIAVEKKRVGESAVDTTKGFLDGIAESFGISTTMLLIGAGVGYYLLNKEPSKKR